MLSRETACVALFTPQSISLKQRWQRRQKNDYAEMNVKNALSIINAVKA